MIERLLYSVLTDGIAAYVANRGFIERMFIAKGLAVDEARRLRDLFQRLPPTVIHNYPRTESKFPLYAIILGEEQETTKFLDDGGGVLDADEAEQLEQSGLAGALIRTSIYTAEFHILVSTEAPDMTLAYYQIARHILSSRRAELKAHGVLDTRLSGSDIAPELSYLPTYLFHRRLTFSCQAEDRAYEERDGGVVRSVSGMHVDDDSEVGRLGNVEALVAPYVEEG